MQNVQSWRDFLDSINNDLETQAYVAQRLGMTPEELHALIQNRSFPQRQHLFMLLHAFPQYRETLLSLLAEEEEVRHPLQREYIALNEEIEIPSVFYSYVLSGSTSLPQATRFWTLSQMILRQALSQFDPDGQGVILLLARCLPPARDGRVHSLRVSSGLGSSLWQKPARRYPLLLGAESLAGWSVMSRRPMVTEHPDNLEFLYPHDPHYGACVAAYPVERAMAVAGCLLVVSARAGFFTSQRRLLVHHYANLLSLAFEPEEFYSVERLNLKVMPPLKTQLQHVASFDQRLQLLDVAAEQCYDITQAETVVWQQIEAELLGLDHA